MSFRMVVLVNKKESYEKRLQARLYGGKVYKRVHRLGFKT